jgi:hypothetical protein
VTSSLVAHSRWIVAKTVWRAFENASPAAPFVAAVTRPVTSVIAAS